MAFAPGEIARGFVAQQKTSGIKKTVRQLAALILDQRLHAQIDQILEDIKREYQREYGYIEATAISAYPLSTALKESLKEKVAVETGATTVTLFEEIDRSLLGGVKLTAPGMELDVSLRSKLAKLVTGSR